MAFRARKQLFCAAASASAPSDQYRAPAAFAAERLAKLVAAGAPAPRMMAAACGILAEWREGSIPPGVLREQLEALRAEIDGGLAAVEDYVADVDEADKPRVRFSWMRSGPPSRS